MGVHISQLPQAVKDKLGLKDTAYKQFWAVVGDKEPMYFRSSWEFYYSLFLEKLKQQKKILDWEHEPQCFFYEQIKRGTRSYLPDFRVTYLDGTQEYVETKGYMDSASKTKIKRMRIYYPEIKLRVVEKEWFRQNLKACKALEPLLSRRVEKK